MTASTARCRHPGLILGLIIGTIGVAAAQPTSPPARPGDGNNDAPADSACNPIFSQWNEIFFLQAVFSSLSIVMCLAVIAVLCKHILSPPPRACHAPIAFRMPISTVLPSLLVTVSLLRTTCGGVAAASDWLREENRPDQGAHPHDHGRRFTPRLTDGYNYTRRSLRSRILVGMFAVNVMYSIGNVIPTPLHYTSNDDLCGTLVVSPTTAAVGKGLFLGSKYAMVLYELFIVGTSLLSLKTGRTELPRRVEISAHATCVAVGVGLFVGWTAHWAPLLADANVDFGEHTSAGTEAGMRVNNEQDAASMVVFQVWIAILVVVVGLWGRPPETPIFSL